MKISLLMILAFITIKLQGQPSFSLVRHSANISQPESITYLDFDNDGDIDFAVASSMDNKITIFEKSNTSDVYLEKVITNTLTKANTVVSGDMDQDGDPDLVACGSTSGNHQIFYFENVNKQFSQPVLVAKKTGNAFQNIEIVDIDKDNDLDFITVEFSITSSPGILFLWLNDGKGNFTEKKISSNSVDGRQTTSSDMDGDGDIDILCSEGLGKKLVLFTNNGSLVFTKSTIAENLNICNSFVTRDINGDNKPDFIVTEYVGDVVKMLASNPDNASYATVVIDNAVDEPSDIKFIDVEQDTDMDIVVSSSGGKKVMLYINKGNNVFTKQVLDNINYAWNLAVVDVNKDNKQDIVMIALTYGGFTVLTNKTIKSATTNLEEWSGFSIESNIVNENLKLNINIDRSRFMISNNAGNMVLSGMIGKYDESINVAHLPGGNYFITAFDDKGKSKTIRFIKT